MASCKPYDQKLFNCMMPIAEQCFEIELIDKRPFQPIGEFRITQINNTTLIPEEIPDESRHQRTSSGAEVMLFVFTRMD